MCLSPKLPSDLEDIDIESFPPGEFIAGLMQLPMVPAAKRHCELIADLKANCSGLRETQMMRIGWLSPTDETRL